MFSKETYVARRAELCSRVGKGLILLPANPEVPNNYPNNTPMELPNGLSPISFQKRVELHLSFS